MSTPTLVVLLTVVAAVFVLPRRWVPVMFLVLACYIPRPQALDMGPLSFTVLRALTVATLARVVLRGDWKGTVVGATDYLMLLWAALMVGTVTLHRDPSVQVIERLGLALDSFGLYMVFRVACRSRDDVKFVCGVLALLLVPLAMSMICEAITGRNVLSLFGGVPEMSTVRDGSVRAQGPFRHSILAGTVGALSVPLVLLLWHTRRWVAVVGLVACLSIVVASHSSGPLLSLAFALLALGMWPLRERLRLMRWAAVGLYGLLSVVMDRPPYYLMARVDLTGSSTGWHRARLIESSLQHLDEWWLAGTDYTRHWMATGVSWSADHTDLTNHYVALGVYGGLPLLLTFLTALGVAFYRIGQQLTISERDGSSSSWLPWALGSTLFTVAITGVSIALFDQSLLWLYMTVAFSSALAGGHVTVVSRERLPASTLAMQHRSARRLRRRAIIARAP